MAILCCWNKKKKKEKNESKKKMHRCRIIEVYIKKGFPKYSGLELGFFMTHHSVSTLIFSPLPVNYFT